VELGVNGHGPDAVDLIDRLVDQLRIWDVHHRHGPGPSFQVYSDQDAVPVGFRIARRHGCFIVNWAG
jgi:protein-L-isoaspartate(D-aspartate) O-methyltransferase